MPNQEPHCIPHCPLCALDVLMDTIDQFGPDEVTKSEVHQAYQEILAFCIEHYPEKNTCDENNPT